MAPGCYEYFGLLERLLGIYAQETIRLINLQKPTYPLEVDVHIVLGCVSQQSVEKALFSDVIVHCNEMDRITHIGSWRCCLRIKLSGSP